jgi:uncharacterized protein (DUF983 family)
MTVTFWTLIGRGARKHCPVCNQGHLFRRWFVMVERCPRCGLKFQRIDGHWSGDLGLNTIVSFSLLFVVVLGTTLATWPDVNTPLLAILAGATTVLVPLVYFPFSKTMWLAIDLALRPLEPGEVDDAYGVDRGHTLR